MTTGFSFPSNFAVLQILWNWQIWKRFQQLRVTMSPSHTYKLTSHGTEPKTLFCVIVRCGATPFHAISTSLCSTVSVVSAIVEEGELAQSTIRITASCCHNHCERKNTITTWKNVYVLNNIQIPKQLLLRVYQLTKTSNATLGFIAKLHALRWTFWSV